MEKDMEKVLQKAEVLIEALPYIQRFNRKIIVVKYGGSAMSNTELQKNVIKDAFEAGGIQTHYRPWRGQGDQPLGGQGRQGSKICGRTSGHR